MMLTHYTRTAYAYDAMQLCPYETIAFGYSAFCDLFTWQEWEDFEYSIDLDFAGTYGFQSPTGRAVGIGYQQEVLARIQNHLITTADGSVNGKAACWWSLPSSTNIVQSRSTTTQRLSPSTRP